MANKKGNNRLFTDEFFKELSKLIILNVIFWIAGDAFVGNVDRTLIKAKFLTFSISFMTSVIYFFLFNVWRIFHRPINIEVDLRNSKTRKRESDLYYGRNFSTNRISMAVNIRVSNSFWNKLALWFIKHKNIEIVICTEPRGNSLICQAESNTKEIRKLKGGFAVCIKSLLESNLKSDVPLEKNCKFIVKENRDMQIKSNTPFPIKPELIISGKPLNFFAKIFTNYTIIGDEQYHMVTFVYD